MLKDEGKRPAATPERSEDFLGRWSRRKRAAGRIVPDATGPRPSGSGTPPVERTEPEPVPPAGEGAQRVLTDADMVPVDSVHGESDVSAFLSPGVSDQLRRLALRKLFQSAEFNVRDGLDDYDDDYTFFEPLGDVVTCDMRHQAEMREQRRREEEDAARARDAQEVDEAGESGTAPETAATDDAPEAASADESAGADDAGDAAGEAPGAGAGDEAPRVSRRSPGAGEADGEESGVDGDSG